MKCNLDCSYCSTDIEKGGHNNSTTHPPLDECLETIDFMYEYADIYMARRPVNFRHVVLNIYGGESLHHPKIVEILKAVREQHKGRLWNLAVTITTNNIVSPKILDAIIPLVDEFTVSYHVENTDKQKAQFRENLLKMQSANCKVKCIILMHPEPNLFDECQQMINWLNQHSIRHLSRQLDHFPNVLDFNYHEQQVAWFYKEYNKRGQTTILPKPVIDQNQKLDMTSTGRTCCGGRQMCADQKYRERTTFVSNQFPDWYCSVDYFFLYIKQVTGSVYLNRDCRMNYQGGIGPIGNLAHKEDILNQAKGQRPIIQCKKKKCLCGICAPKAQDLDTYKTIMRKYEIPNSNLL